MRGFMHMSTYRFKPDQLFKLKINRNAPEEFRVEGILNCVTTHRECEYLLMLIKTAQHLNLKITRAKIERATRNMNAMQELTDWFLQLFKSAALPHPPWKGNDRIKPVCSRADLEKVDDEFGDCFSFCRERLFLGYDCLYICEFVPAVIALKRDAVFGWEINTIKGLGNKGIKPNFHRLITQDLSAAGFKFRVKQSRAIRSAFRLAMLDG